MNIQDSDILTFIDNNPCCDDVAVWEATRAGHHEVRRAFRSMATSEGIGYQRALPNGGYCYTISTVAKRYGEGLEGFGSGVT